MHRAWHAYAFAVLNAVALAYMLLAPNPWWLGEIPRQMALRPELFPYFYLLLAFAGLSFSPALVVWTALVSALSWSVGVALIALRPDSILPVLTRVGEEGFAPVTYLDPHFVDLRRWFTQVTLFLVIAAILAVGVRRTRRLVRREARAARERANLARYFSPNLVEELSRADEPLGGVRSQNVGVLFADIVGFTRMVERATPEATIAMLRDFHGRMARTVFAHGGTLDKYIGDAVMATFGTPRAGGADATNALRCAAAMVEECRSWSAARAAKGEPPVAIGVGVHYGPAVLGDIGDARRLEFAVIGDTVNVASRLETHTRALGAACVASADVLAAARREGASDADLGGFAPAPSAALKGRDGPVEVWTLAGALA